MKQIVGCDSASDSMRHPNAETAWYRGYLHKVKILKEKEGERFCVFMNNIIDY